MTNKLKKITLAGLTALVMAGCGNKEKNFNGIVIYEKEFEKIHAYAFLNFESNPEIIYGGFPNRIDPLDSGDAVKIHYEDYFVNEKFEPKFIPLEDRKEGYLIDGKIAKITKYEPLKDNLWIQITKPISMLFKYLRKKGGVENNK